VGKSLESYYSDESEYPGTVGVVVAAGHLQAEPQDPKTGSLYIYTPPAGLVTSFCLCANVEEVSRGNSTTETCAMGTGVTGPYYCRKGQQE